MTFARLLPYNFHMSPYTQTIERAKNEIKSVLERYRLTWLEVAPDIDESIWKNLKPTAKKVRQELLRKTYPSLAKA